MQKTWMSFSLSCLGQVPLHNTHDGKALGHTFATLLFISHLEVKVGLRGSFYRTQKCITVNALKTFMRNPILNKNILLFLLDYLLDYHPFNPNHSQKNLSPQFYIEQSLLE